MNIFPPPSQIPQSLPLVLILGYILPLHRDHRRLPVAPQQQQDTLYCPKMPKLKPAED